MVGGKRNAPFPFSAVSCTMGETNGRSAMAIRAILYDNDGTLVDTHDLILASMRHATGTVLGKEFPEEELMAGVGTPLAAQMLVFAQGDEEVCDELLRVYRTHNHALHDQAVRLFPDVLEGLRDLHGAGIRMGVVTAKLHPLAQRGLQIVGAWDYLDCLVGPDDCPKAKPAPDSVVMGADLLGCAPHECIYLGDSPFDMQAGIAAGCVTVAALWGMFPKAELVAYGPAHACGTFADFTRLALELAAE